MALGLSAHCSLSGQNSRWGFRAICQNLLEKMKAEGIDDIPLAVGGVIPKQDIPKLNAMGIRGVFPGGTSFDDIVAGIQNLAR